MHHGEIRGYLLKRFLQIENDLFSERITAIIHPLPPHTSHHRVWVAFRWVWRSSVMHEMRQWALKPPHHNPLYFSFIVFQRLVVFTWNAARVLRGLDSSWRVGKTQVYCTPPPFRRKMIAITQHICRSSSQKYKFFETLCSLEILDVLGHF